MRIETGYMPFRGYRTFWRIVRPEHEKHAPLLLLHGGPGSTHNYFETLDAMADASERAIVSYDQLGCGESWVEGSHPELWNMGTWMAELIALREALGLKELHILGQSWGGMLLIAYLIDKRPAGVRSAILASTLSSSRLWGEAQHEYIKAMSREDQEAIAEAERTGNYSGEAYDRAVDRFMELHCAGAVTEQSPECLRRAKRSGSEAYVTAWGPSEFAPLGNLRDFDYTVRLGQINVPCLVTSGTVDLCSERVARTMAEGIPGAEWKLFPGCRHMSFVEANEQYMLLLGDWLHRHDQ